MRRARRTSFSPRERLGQGVAVVVVMALAGSLALRMEVSDSEHHFDTRAHDLSLQVARELAEGKTLIAAAHGVLQGGPGVADGLSARLVGHYIEDHPQVRWMAYAERLDAGDEAHFEARLRDEGLPGLRVHPLPQAVAPGAMRLPVYRLEPLRPHSAPLLGADLLTRPQWRGVILDAVDTGGIRATVARVPELDLNGVLLLRAVYRGRVEPADTLSRERQLAGILMLFLDADSLLAPMDAPRAGITARLLSGDGPGARPLAESGATVPGPMHATVFPMTVANLHLPLEFTGPIRPRPGVIATALALAVLLCMSMLHGLRLRRAAREEEEAALAQALLAEVTLHSIGEAVVRLDAQGRVRYMNPVAETMSGMRARVAHGRLLEEVLELECDGPVTGTRVSRLHDHEAAVTLHLPGRKSRALACTLTPLDEGRGHAPSQVLVMRDVTREDELSRELAYQASHDPLTDLPNRREFERKLGRAIGQAQRGEHQHCVFYVDLDQFKLVNDTCGHAAGDRMLRQIAGLLASELRDGDVLARLGGDEFGVLLGECSVHRAMPVAERICDAVADFRFMWDGRAFELGASIGVVGIGPESGTVDDVQRAADLACYAAKDTGRNRVHLYRHEDHVISRNHREMQWHAEIKDALERDRFVLHCQPIRRLHANTRVGAMNELLLRMVDEDGALVPPMAFLPAAERYGLMSTLDRAVVDMAFAHVSELATSGDVYNINLSGQSLTDPLLGEFILTSAARGAINPSRVCFEVTETAAISNLAVASQLMARLRREGFRFALDDFGAGLSSFGYLKQLPVDFIKIDGQFVRDVNSDPVAKAMVASIVNVARVLKIETVAEKVEDEATERCLRAMGVDYVQGFHVGRPHALGTTTLVGLARSA